jgi:hypothetical protein
MESQTSIYFYPYNDQGRQPFILFFATMFTTRILLSSTGNGEIGKDPSLSNISGKKIYISIKFEILQECTISAIPPTYFVN